MFQANSPFMRTVTNGNFLYGFAAGAIVAVIATNPSVQRALFRTAAKTATLVKGGIAEAQERFHDAEAEIQLEAEETAQPVQQNQV